VADVNPKIGVVGAGAWGTALASLLARKGYEVVLWAYEQKVVQDINKNHRNSVYLAGFDLPENLTSTSDLIETITDKDLILSVCPAQFVRSLTAEWAPHARPDALIVSASKGIETGTTMLVSAVLEEVLPEHLHHQLAFLSGPSFAKEVVQSMPTVVSIAAYDEYVAERVQHIFYSPDFRTYRTTDVIGVEVGGALKNVMAIATGMADGLGLGYNARAALITRGMVELTRMAAALGADPLTMMGLAGFGDLVLTCTGDLSRNRMVGMALGKGQPLQEVLDSMPQVVEGVTTAKSAYNLARKLNVETPILDEIYFILHEGRPVEGGTERLMMRSLKREEL